MRVAFGLRAHSGWAVLVVVGVAQGEPRIVDRRRVELIDKAETAWARQPYHAAERLAPEAAHVLVERGIEAARRNARQALEAAVMRAREWKHEVAACGLVMPAPMPAWSIAEILAVHFRMHKAEGVLFPDALARAAQICGMPVLALRESQLDSDAPRALGIEADALARKISALGKTIGSPWGKDQKHATVAALMALQRNK